MMPQRKNIDSQALTGSILPPATFNTLQRRLRTIKNFNYQNTHNITRQSLDNSVLNASNKAKPSMSLTIDAQTDTFSTNFWPNKPRLQSNAKHTTVSMTKPRKISYEASKTNNRPTSGQKKRIRMIKGAISIAKQNQNMSQTMAVVFKRQLAYFQKLYQQLGKVLAAIKMGLIQFQQAVSSYSRQLLSPHFSFIDDFLIGKQQKLRKTVRTSRIHQCLSVAYLFLQIAQQRMDDNQSYLVNFIGHCLSNLIFTAKTYIIKEGLPQYQYHQFQKAIDQFQISSFGHRLVRIQEVLLRMQHNNQIITMMHKKLGRFNPKFEQCIKIYLKNAQRKKQTCAQCAHQIFQFLAMHIHQLQLLGVSETLQIAPAPYVRPAQKEYTLVIQPLGVLVSNGKYRPFMIQFFKWAVKHFQIILWTWQMLYQVQQICEKLDQFLVAKLFRHHCKIVDQIYTKDLNRLGRKTDKIVVIDFDKRITPWHQKQTIQCRWKGQSKDNGLLVICQVLEQMLSSNSSVQDAFTFYAQQIHSVRGH